MAALGGFSGRRGLVRKETKLTPAGSPNQVGCYHTEEFTGTDDLGVLPELGKMPLVSRHQVVCTCSIRTFNEYVVGWIGGDLTETRGCDEVGMVLDQLQQLLP
jgi:hypothetical protein